MSSLEVRTAQLEEDLSGRYAAVNGFAASLREALGQRGDQPLNPDEVAVLAYLIRPTDQLITTWMVTPTGFVVHELARNGNHLVVTVPLWRIRRVVETRVDEVLTVTVEIDADHTAIESTGVFALPTDGWEQASGGQDAGPGRFQGISTMRAANYEATPSKPAEEKAVKAFARVMRAVIVAG